MPSAAANALVFVARLMVFARGVGRLCAHNHIEAAGNPHKWLKYDSCTVSAFVLNAFALGESVHHTIQAHLFTPLLSALLSLGATVYKTVYK
jgi:predicted Co/Zn/Cd cation transporter (cation efflux family)